MKKFGLILLIALFGLFWLKALSISLSTDGDTLRGRMDGGPFDTHTQENKKEIAAQNAENPLDLEARAK